MTDNTVSTENGDTPYLVWGYIALIITGFVVALLGHPKITVVAHTVGAIIAIFDYKNLKQKQRRSSIGQSEKH